MKLPRITRRRFLQASGLTVGMAVGLGGYVWGIEPHWPEFVERRLPIAHLPEALIGKTMVQLSDLHVGPIVDNRYLLAMFEQVAEISPDLIVITGDFMTYVDSGQIQQTNEVLQYLPRPPLGCYAVLGNHDYGTGSLHPNESSRERIRIADRLTEVLRGQDITLLREELEIVAGLQLVGLDDLWSPRFSTSGILYDVDPNRAALVLCHNPDTVDRPMWAGYQGWILAGHTHGGQCKCPFLPPPIVPIKNMRYVAGEVDLFDGRRLYVNRGLGYLRRVRFNARPEITQFHLERA